MSELTPESSPSNKSNFLGRYLKRGPLKDWDVWSKKRKTITGVLVAFLLAVILSAFAGGSDSGSGSQASGGKSCPVAIGAWVMSTSDFIQSYPNDLPPVISTFGTSSPIEGWVMGQLGTYMQNVVSNGMASAVKTLYDDATQECKSLASSGEDISNIPSP
jgi:hypothetical protein